MRGRPRKQPDPHWANSPGKSAKLATSEIDAAKSKLVVAYVEIALPKASS